MITIGITTYKIHISKKLTEITKKCIESVKAQGYTSIIVDGHSKFIPETDDIKVIHGNGGLYSAWNTICRTAFYDNNNDYAMILNNDIILSSNIKDIIEDVENNRSLFTSSMEIHGSACQPYSAFVIKRHLYEKVGPFDDRYKFLYGDIDYQQRIEKLGIKQHMSKKFIVEHYEHGTAFSSEMKDEIDLIKKNDTETMNKLMGGWFEPLMLIDEKGKVITKKNYMNV